LDAKGGDGNMYRYLKDHESYIMNLLASEKELEWGSIAAYHKTQIHFLQQERLAHLVVTCVFGILLFLSSITTAFVPIPALYGLDLILGVTLVFYIVHYYRLENGVQRWYRLYISLLHKSGDLPPSG
jgi:hypothetical protein